MATTEFATDSHKSAGSGFLFAIGFALLAAGVGFALAPHYSWQVTKIARQASAFGVENGVLVVGGLVFFGLSFVARAVSAAAPVDHSAGNDDLKSDMHLLNEQLAAKLAQLRTSVMQLQEGLATVAAQQQNQLENTSARPGGGDHSQDAMFRLAASLDQLHAHFDERVHAVDLQLRSGFETLLNVTHDLRRTLDVRPHTPAASPAARTHAGHGQAQAQPAAQEGTIDFYETMQKLDAIAGASEAPPPQAPPRGRTQQPQPPFPSQGAESLDALLPEEYRDRY